MSGRLRFAVAGLGWGARYLPAYLAAPECELELICDADAAKAERLSKEFGVPWSADFADCLGEGIDAVDVSTPNHLHAEQAVAALSAGKHVLLQKPMARSAEECARIVAAARAADRALGMFMSTTSRPLIGELREMIAAGAFGRVISLRGRNAHRNIHSAETARRRPADYWRRDREQVGGGAMALIGIHYIDLMQWITGRKIVSVCAESDNLAARELMSGDDVTAAICRMDDGAVAVLEASYSSRGNSLEIYGTGGWARTDHNAAGLEIALEKPWKGRVLDLPATTGGTRVSREEIERLSAPLRDEFCQQAAFARAVLAGKPPPITGEEGMRDVAVLEAIYRSADSGRRERPVLPEV
ncbi:MAG: Gfo/Idh/MocA family protein [Planctomycetota bacterium]|jgi:predicted dehydrogenase